MAKRERRAYPQWSVRSEQRRQTPQSALARRVASVFGLACVARQSQTTAGMLLPRALARPKIGATRSAWVFQQTPRSLLKIAPSRGIRIDFVDPPEVERSARYGRHTDTKDKATANASFARSGGVPGAAGATCFSFAENKHSAPVVGAACRSSGAVERDVETWRYSPRRLKTFTQ